LRTSSREDRDHWRKRSKRRSGAYRIVKLSEGFAWHSALDIVEPSWQAARQAAAKRSSFFAHILTLTGS
jgi:hypothetical protein